MVATKSVKNKNKWVKRFKFKMEALLQYMKMRKVNKAFKHFILNINKKLVTLSNLCRLIIKIYLISKKFKIKKADKVK